MTGDLPGFADVVIVGAGPAGLAAAAELKARGVGSVLVLEREAQAGGIPRHCGHFPFGMREFHRLLRGPAYAARLLARAQAAGAVIKTGVTVTALHPGPGLSVASAGGLRQITARRVLLCTGVRESTRAARLIGGTKPGGVLSTGALQGMVHLQALRPFRNPVVLGTELVSFSALLTCRHLGIRPAAMIEPGPRVTARRPAGLLPRLLGVPLLRNTSITAIEGRDRVTGVSLQAADGARRRIACDGVIVTGGFRPEAALLRESHLAMDPATGGPVVDQFGHCSDPAYFAAGNLLRPVETAGWSWNEGRIIGRVIAESLGDDVPNLAQYMKIDLQGDVLKYILPQTISASPAPAALRQFQLRVTRPARGRLILRVNGEVILSRALSALPERRITLPLNALPAGVEGVAEVSFEEGPA
ncbi:pyridine nucleotide-disulfide oxidoreductase [Rhodovulum sp. NI22]|nr:pyridine nucleotide-disulfide oxidoreductase [Rhodovulum sp. NI22]